MRVALYTLGCKVNQFETAALAEGFISKGADIVNYTQEADIYVVNTCTVTSRAAYQSRQILRRLRRSRKKSRIIATGCYVQVGAQEILDAVPGQVCLVGNGQKAQLVDLAFEMEDGLEFYVGSISRVTTIAPFTVKRQLGRTRAFVRIQDGCNSFCTYCIVPYARGRSRSLAPELVEKQVKTMVREGIKEVVLTGIHIGMYGGDLVEKTSLLDLLKSLCAAFPQLRFRLSSIEPSELTQDMISWASSTPNFCPHWHIPLQSGSDNILKRMNRHYTSSHYRNLIMELRTAMPEAAIGADVLAGFPGEDEPAFEKTMELISELPITYVHAFPFSPRPGTVAAAMNDMVPKKEKARRCRAVRNLGNEKKQAFYHSQAGKIFECLVEQQDKETDLWKGLTPNYVPVLIETGRDQADLKNQVLPVRITKAEKGMAFGTLLK
ncbi:MAG: tRNA (N(6)-L-threonylcarbamoyladenosine(37)-C(2))-methylthiotransferase MtaB [Deltaproteobacteria bacterium]|nr:MAG: tRNA (N(6)-L-threonylcarbamoyladenosine(37)-C(2))-methylthiotransferase MtaB [Deltaproteobacteria bacterium]